MKDNKKNTKGKIVKMNGSEEAAQRNEQLMENRKKRKKMVTLLVLLALVLSCAVVVYLRTLEYKSFKILENSETDYENTASYICFSENLLKYTPDGVSYIDAKGNTVWTTGINMKIPVAVSSGDYAVVADLNGNTVCVFGAQGEISSLTMPYPISDIDVGQQGAFAVVLESEKTNYINMYNRKGEIIYEMQTTIDKSGYPLDITISDNGEKLFTSYAKIGSGVMENNLAAYNFGEVGQNTNADRVVGGYKFDDQIFSKVEFVNNDTVVAFGTKSIQIYSMKEKPSLRDSIKFNEEIKSIFYSEDYIGVIQKEAESQTHLYKLRLFNLRGREEFSEWIDFDYDYMFADKKEIIVSGGMNCMILRRDGSIKYCGKLDGRIQSIVPIGRRLEYVVGYENKTQTIRLRASMPEVQQQTVNKITQETATGTDSVRK